LKQVLAKKIAVLTASVLTLTACSDSTDSAAQSLAPSADTEIVVLAAASLTQTFTEISSKFELANPGVKVTISFAGSATLAEQIKQGAPVDVFASASSSAMSSVINEIPNSKTFARNRVVIAYPRANPKNIMTSRDLNNKDLIWIQCDHQVPCGAAADEALAVDGVTGKPKSLEPDVNSVLNKLLAGEVDAAIVYLTDVFANSNLTSLEFSDKVSAATSYSIGTSSAASSAAQDFVAFVLAQSGQDVLIAAGFDAPSS
jgi:molybdate transport system substrate-binding protein